MVGRRTVHELWESATESLGDDAPTQNEGVQVLGQLQVQRHRWGYPNVTVQLALNRE